MRALLCIFLLSVVAEVATAQIWVTDRIKKQSISKVLSKWSDNYRVDFAYDSFELDQYTFSGAFEATPLEDALRQLLVDTPFRFRWLNGTCIIFPGNEIEITRTDEPQPASIISGAVSDRLSGESLPFASATAIQANSATTADADGRFTLTRNSAVTLDTLVVIYLGYTVGRFPFNWNEPNGAFNIELVPSNALLPDVEVRATSVKPILLESEASAFSVNPNLSGLRFGVGEADVLRTAQFAPGISGVQENNNGLFIRGSSSDQSQLLFDGFNIYHQDHFLGMFSSLNALAVKTMRIHKCPTDPVLGGRVAGTMEVIGREGDLRKPSGLIDMGTMSISGSFETPLDTTGKASLFLCGRRSITEWVKGPAYRELFRTLYAASIVSERNDLPDETGESFDPELLFQDLNTKFTYKPSWKNHFNASFYASRDDLNFSYADTSSLEVLNVTDIRYSDEASKANRGAAVRWIHRVSPRLEVHTSVGYSAFQGVYFSTDSIRNNLFATDSTRFEYRDVLLRDWIVSHRWNVRSRNHAISMGASVNRIATNEKTRAQSEADRSDEQAGVVLSAFIGDEWRSSRWLLKPALRMSHYNHEPSRLYLEPKLAMRYSLYNQVLFVKGAATRAVQFVQRITNQSLYQNVPDQWQLSSSTLPVLKADQFMVGANWTPSAWNIDIELYTKRTEGQVLNAAAGQYTNIAFDQFYTGVAKVRGMDVGAQWERPPHRVMAAFSRIWAKSNYDGFEYQEIQESYFRGNEGKLIYEWKKGPWNVSVVCIAAQGAPYTPLLGTYLYAMPDGSANVFPIFGGYNRAQTDAYFRTDLALGYRWQWSTTQWQLNVSLYNVFDTPNYKAIQYSVGKSTLEDRTINERQIQMLGRIPSMNLLCRF
jgi:ferric enterobactin receptor